jgi:transcription elongation factor Elf1
MFGWTHVVCVLCGHTWRSLCAEARGDERPFYCGRCGMYMGVRDDGSEPEEA